jgi:hypothetical protein
MVMNKRAPIDTRAEDGALLERRFRYCRDVEYYYGLKGDERLNEKWVARNNSKRYYEGSKGEERLTQVCYPNGKIMLYVGERGEERLSRVRYPDKTVEYYEGAKGMERLRSSWIERAQCTRHYEGNRGEEVLAIAIYDSGKAAVYTGNPGEERLMSIRHPDGMVDHYQGAWGQERLTHSRQENADYDSDEELYGYRVPESARREAAYALRHQVAALRDRLSASEFAELKGAAEAYIGVTA